MRIQVLSVQRKDIKTKAGQEMTLRIVNAVNNEGEVMRYTLPRSHDDIPTGPANVVAEPYINYEAELGGRVRIVPITSAGKNPLDGKAA